MAMPIVYIDRSDIRPGTTADLQRAVIQLVRFVEAREPRLISYSFHIDHEASTMTVVAVHPDSASLELHLTIGGPEFRKVGAFVTLRLIEVFGEPSETVRHQLHEKARMLGEAEVIVRPSDVGFGRVPPRPPDASPGGGP